MSLSLQNLRLGYSDKTVVALDDLHLPTGKISCLIGPNGCGKSTLLRGLSGLLLPQQGQVTLDDKPLMAWPKRALAKRLTILPQDPQAPDGITLGQLVSQGRYPHQHLLKPATKADQEACDWAMEITGITAFRDRLFNTLSGGERQRGWIAMALAQQTDFLLLDEPNSFLDIGHQLDMMALLQSLNQQLGLSILMVLHEINHACQFADQLYVMRRGALIAAGRPEQVMTSQLLAEVFQVRSKVVMLEEAGRRFPHCLITASL